MVEMRWVWGSEPAPELGENFARSVRVLQYRQEKLIEDIVGGQPMKYHGWSEWIDVPTVTEP